LIDGRSVCKKKTECLGYIKDGFQTEKKENDKKKKEKKKSEGSF
jgi:hypothetical protein